MSRKTTEVTELYVNVFQKVQQLVPQFAPTYAMADFDKGRRQQQQRGRGQSGTAPASSDDFTQRRRNQQRWQLHQPLKTAAKCVSWRHVLASHWCRADMRHGSVNLVLCAICYAQIWLRDALFVVLILP